MFKRFVATGGLVFWIRLSGIVIATVKFSNQNTFFMLMLHHEENSENESYLSELQHSSNFRCVCHVT